MSHYRHKTNHITLSKDGTPIRMRFTAKEFRRSYLRMAWSCDARYFRAQVLHFSKKHRVAVLDVAGHGHTGIASKHYTMGAFKEDVRAVTEATGSKTVILIGRSWRPGNCGGCPTTFNR